MMSGFLLEISFHSLSTSSYLVLSFFFNSLARYLFTAMLNGIRGQSDCLALLVDYPIIRLN